MTILKIKSQLTKAGKPVVIVETAEKTHFVPWGQWMQAASEDLNAYIGGQFVGMYFAKGDTLFNGQECTADDTILDNFTVSMNAEVAAHAVILTNKAKATSMNEAMLLQRRLRNERTAAAAKANPAPLVS